MDAAETIKLFSENKNNVLTPGVYLSQWKIHKDAHFCPLL